jgi:hypothetical protein
MIGRLKAQIERNQRAEAHAARYDSGKRDVKVRTLQRFLHDLRGQDVLDAGCGTGDVASMCSGQGARVAALGVYEPMLRKARDRYDNAFAAIQGSVEALPFKPSQLRLGPVHRRDRAPRRPERLSERSSAGAAPRWPFDDRIRQHAAFLGPREVAKTSRPKETTSRRAPTQLPAAFPSRDSETDGPKRRIAAHQVRYLSGRCLRPVDWKSSRRWGAALCAGSSGVTPSTSSPSKPSSSV